MAVLLHMCVFSQLLRLVDRRMQLQDERCRDVSLNTVHMIVTNVRV